MNTATASKLCPHCQCALGPLSLGKVEVSACENCHGLWIDRSVFKQICEDPKQQASILGSPASASPTDQPVKYVKCPVCSELMNRKRFDRSTVIIDLCAPHGTWLDANELQHIVALIRAGGCDAAKSFEAEQRGQKKALYKLTVDAQLLPSEKALLHRDHSDFDGWGSAFEILAGIGEIAAGIDL